MLLTIPPESIKPLGVQYYFMLGEALKMQGKNLDARTYYIKALNSNPNSKQRKLLEQLSRQ